MTIENAHRVGTHREGRDRHIIANFVYRPERQKVLTKSRNVKNSHIFITDDLIPEDRQAKNSFREYMNMSYKAGKNSSLCEGKIICK